ncbi:MAG: hypothetical protein ACP5VQ_05020 [Phycisphaerae bacterium]
MFPAITIEHFAARYAVLLQSWSQLLWLWDLALLLLGFVFLFTARRTYRTLIMANCAALGWYLAMFLAHWSWIAGAVAALIGTVLGVLLVPMMRIALFILGAIAGGAVGVALWHVYKQSPDYRWVPAMLGVIVLGIAGLYIFDIMAVLFCTLEGSILIVIGATGLILRYGTANLRHAYAVKISSHPINLLAVIIGITCIGLLVQLSFTTASKDKSAAE